MTKEEQDVIDVATDCLLAWQKLTQCSGNLKTCGYNADHVMACQLRKQCSAIDAYRNAPPAKVVKKVTKAMAIRAVRTSQHINSSTGRTGRLTRIDIEGRHTLLDSIRCGTYLKIEVIK